MNNNFFSAKELLNDKKENFECLVEPIMPASGLVALVGASDCGKSTLLRQLAANIVKGEQFLKWETKPRHKRVLYASTEDDRYSVSKAFGMQNMNLDMSDEEAERLEFVFGSGHTLCDRVFERVEECSYDLVIMDTFEDLCSEDINQAHVIRKVLNPFHDISVKCGTLFLFTNHTAKNTTGRSPDKNNILGSQAFESKMRLVMQLCRDKKSGRLCLCILKANYLPARMKERALMLTVDDRLVFAHEEATVPLERITL